VDALVKRINSLQGWIDEYDRMLDDERDPLRRADYTQQLERLRPRLDEAQQEYNQLQNAPGGPASTQLQQVGDKLDAMDNKLDTLLTGQTATREELKALVVRYDAGEQKIIATIMEHVPPADLSNLQAVLDALDTNRLSLAEMQTALTGIREAQDQLQQQGHSLPDAPPLPDGDNPALDVRHRLKLTVPLLPLFLSYEGEVELNSGVKLKDVWADLVRKARGK
jgi:chromosome segregation ATPase